MRALTDWLLTVALVVGFGPAGAQPTGQGPALPAEPLVRIAPAPVPLQVAQPDPAAEYRRRAEIGFQGYKPRLMQIARSAGVREATIQAIVPGLRLNARAIELDRGQAPVGPGTGRAYPLSPYLQRHVTPSLISRGQARYYSHWPHLVRINTRTGVDPAVLMAIYGKETAYGSFTGGFDLLEVLASLAYDGRRRDLFE